MRMTMPASSAAIAARYSDPLRVEISFCAYCIWSVPPGRRSLDKSDDAGRQRGRIAPFRPVAVRIGGDVLDEVTPDPASLDVEVRRRGVVFGAGGLRPAGDVERGEVGYGDVCLAAAAERREVGDHQLHDPWVRRDIEVRPVHWW